MKKINDYKNYDSLTIYVKKNKLDEILEYYKLMSWEVVTKVEDAQYEDIIDVTLIRPHKIQNKDELQLYQVYIEERLNNIAKLERNKHAKTTSIGLCVGTLGLGLIILGILNFLKFIDFGGLIGGIIMCSIGSISLIIECISLPKLYKKEITTFKHTKKQLEQELKDICQQVKTLVGEQHDKD